MIVKFPSENSCLFFGTISLPFRYHVYLMPGIPKAIQGRVTVLLETDVMSFGFIIHSGLAAKEAKLQVFVLYRIYNV